NGTTDHINSPEVIAYAANLPGVSTIWLPSDISLTDAEQVAREIKKNNLKRIVIAGNNAGMHKSFFSRAMVLAGNNPEDVILASFLEYGASHKSDVERAKAIVACAVYGVPFEMAAVPEELPVNPNTLVIGGGIAGIQASLEIAASKNIVYLVEKSGTIGGHMAMFDKTFPTLDCAACILTPKMVEVGQHNYIKLMTYSKVQEVSGVPGNYTVKILKKARKINLETCIGCGTCAEKCPSKAPSEFDANTTLRRAAYIPFPQAVPNKYLIDDSICTYTLKGKCGACVKVCPVPGCINLDEKDEVVEINVGNIIVATGFKTFNATKFAQFGYGKFPNVLTSIELERLINAAGPTGGKIAKRVQDKKGNWVFSTDSIYTPKSIAIIHCIGSRDVNHNKYCSKVCCMYSLKLAHLLKEKLPDSEINEYYIDIRAYGKGYEEFYNRIKKEGVNIVRGRPAKVEQYGDELIVRCEDIERARMIEQRVDMVILAVGTEPRTDSENVAEMLGITIDSYGWFKEFNYISDPVNTFSGGIAIAGACQGPKDIPDTVAQASAAASRVLQSIAKNKIRNGIRNLSLEQIETKAKELSKILQD
ncbi:MAG TPA: CoB--CoM heterodisulfide reductase iron-sulfur subunit A family protein, partial [Chitinophagaceae bacterium]|nr:CoB--CoM heterodisulfide reductase iron-sulfur subunit A family protein [Chitinophagaceae bacterium]